MKLINQGYILDVEKLNNQKNVCMCTSIFRHSTKRLFSSFRNGTTKESPDGNGVIAESENGTEWRILFSGFQTVFDGIQGEIKAVELSEKLDGNLFAFLSWFDRTKGSKLYNPSSDTILPARIILVDSYDMGKTWENYRTIDIGDLQGPALTGPVVKVPDGYLVFFEKYGPEQPSGPSLHAACALFSKDGIIFDRIITVARHPENKIFYWDQRNAYDVDSGKIISMFWTYDRENEKDIDIHIAYGNPDTLTWTVPQSTGIQGQIAMPIPLTEGRLLCFYVHRHHPGSMRLVMSYDKGKTWDIANEMVIYENQEIKEKGVSGESSYAEYWEDMGTWSFGHPCGIMLDENLGLLVYYAGRDVKKLSARYAIVSI